MLKELNFEIGEVWHYDLHGVIPKRIKEINASAYEHESGPELEWNYDEAETLATKEKNPKKEL